MHAKHLIIHGRVIPCSLGMSLPQEMSSMSLLAVSSEGAFTVTCTTLYTMPSGRASGIHCAAFARRTTFQMGNKTWLNAA